MDNKGFSLIELMVVVAIIGILSAVAVPQFQKFQRKAKQSEAKALLAGAYTAQKAFRAETGSYYSNLWATGFEAEGTLIYNVGFAGGSPLGSNLAGYTATPYQHNENTNTWSICGTTYSAGIGVNCSLPTGVVNTEVTLNGLTTITSSTFTMVARAAKVSLNGSVNDAWSLNHRKELVNTANGAL